MEAILLMGVWLVVLLICLPCVELDALVSAKSRPIGELGPLEIHPVGANCKVCCSGMSSRIVFCSQCRTAHHEECWAYAGKCSTYACGGIQGCK